jgi:hypothetical protein
MLMGTTGLGEEIVMEIYKKFKFKEISRTEDVQATVSSRRRRKEKKKKKKRKKKRLL